MVNISKFSTIDGETRTTLSGGTLSYTTDGRFLVSGGGETDTFMISGGVGGNIFDLILFASGFVVMRRVILFLFLTLFFGFSYGAETLTGPAQVGDGDDLVIEGRKIRLHGVDAPEWNQACLLDNGKDFYPGREAKAWLESFVARKVVSCNVETTDKYGRKVSTCFVDGKNINEILVQEGFAFAYEFFSDRYVKFQKEARSDKSGLWRGSCAMPWDWRKKNPR